MSKEEELFDKLYKDLIDGNRNSVRAILNRFNKAKLMRFVAYYNEQSCDWQETISDIYRLFNN